jgi:hypothetical protein
VQFGEVRGYRFVGAGGLASAHLSDPAANSGPA